MAFLQKVLRGFMFNNFLFCTEASRNIKDDLRHLFTEFHNCFESFTNVSKITASDKTSPNRTSRQAFAYQACVTAF